MENAEQLLTVNQVCARLQMSRASIYRLIGANRLRSIKLGRSRRIALSDLTAYLDSIREAA